MILVLLEPRCEAPERGDVQSTLRPLFTARAFSKRYAREFHKSQKRLFPTRIPVIAPITTQMNGEARRSCIILICPETCDRK